MIDLLSLSLKNFLRFVVKDQDGVVLVLPSKATFIEFHSETLQVRNIESFVVFLVHSSQNNFLLVVIDLELIVLFWPLEVSYAPFKSLD